MDNNSNKPFILKNAREAKGLTLEAVHEATRIPVDSLKAMEENAPLTASYYRGFIKIYAEFLGLDVTETFKHFGLDRRLSGDRSK